MKIGILTFHWATNYGAILQAYCLQEYLREQSHEVEIINYKSRKYDLSWFSFLKHPSNWLSIRKYPLEKKKETLLKQSRNKYLCLTERFWSEKQLMERISHYDILISGSDQVFNPYYTTLGEGYPTSVYYLPFGDSKTIKIGYAVSFGCKTYPEHALNYAQKWIRNFNVIGTRERTGLDILQQMGFEGKKFLVPDPTILYGKSFFKNLGISVPTHKENYICVYMLRQQIVLDGDVLYIDGVHNPLTLEEWLSTISHAKAMVTNSYHGMIVAILAHVPFVALMEKKKAGMNDRFYTLLKRINLSERIAYDESSINSIINQHINWEMVDAEIDSFSQIGKSFLSETISIKV